MAKQAWAGQIGEGKAFDQMPPRNGFGEVGTGFVRGKGRKGSQRQTTGAWLIWMMDLVYGSAQCVMYSVCLMMVVGAVLLVGGQCG